MDEIKLSLMNEAEEVATALWPMVEDLVITGSVALEVCGLPLSRSSHDVDIHVICTDEQFKYLRFLNSVSGLIYKEEYPDSNLIKFKFRDRFNVDIWRVEKIDSEICVKKNGYKYMTVLPILKKKASYKRPKDISDLMDLVSTLAGLINA